MRMSESLRVVQRGGRGGGGVLSLELTNTLPNCLRPRLREVAWPTLWSYVMCLLEWVLPLECAPPPLPLRVSKSKSTLAIIRRNTGLLRIKSERVNKNMRVATEVVSSVALAESKWRMYRQLPYGLLRLSNAVNKFCEYSARADLKTVIEWLYWDMIRVQDCDGSYKNFVTAASENGNVLRVVK